MRRPVAQQIADGDAFLSNTPDFNARFWDGILCVLKAIQQLALEAGRWQSRHVAWARAIEASAQLKMPHVCSLCGKRGHNVLRRKLPGAARHRALLAEEKKIMGMTSKQRNRRKPQKENKTWGSLKKERSKQYLGPKPCQKAKAAVEDKPARKATFRSDVVNRLPLMQKTWVAARKICLLRLPRKCQKCVSSSPS